MIFLTNLCSEMIILVESQEAFSFGYRYFYSDLIFADIKLLWHDYFKPRSHQFCVQMWAQQRLWWASTRSTPMSASQMKLAARFSKKEVLSEAYATTTESRVTPVMAGLLWDSRTNTSWRPDYQTAEIRWPTLRVPRHVSCSDGTISSKSWRL